MIDRTLAVPPVIRDGIISLAIRQTGHAQRRSSQWGRHNLR
jgi:hypothetical protein